MTADHTSMANVNQNEGPTSEWNNFNIATTGYNYDASQENLVDDDMYTAGEMDNI